ncbi:unnamed protein product [Clavelina lepadiformis]|uniref:Uncharacterized protein n=1 Tax=Clavelina lepadiformis TaxID=159417 RepID=A0ABP0FY87_CLALP
MNRAVLCFLCSWIFIASYSATDATKPSNEVIAANIRRISGEMMSAKSSCPVDEYFSSTGSCFSCETLCGSSPKLCQLECPTVFVLTYSGLAEKQRELEAWNSALLGISAVNLVLLLGVILWFNRSSLKVYVTKPIKPLAEYQNQKNDLTMTSEVGRNLVNASGIPESEDRSEELLEHPHQSARFDSGRNSPEV